MDDTGTEMTRLGGQLCWIQNCRGDTILGVSTRMLPEVLTEERRPILGAKGTISWLGP